MFILVQPRYICIGIDDGSLDTACAMDGGEIGSEQALAPVWLLDTFAEGAWDKVPKTEGTFDFVFPTTIVHGFYKNYIGFFFVC